MKLFQCAWVEVHAGWDLDVISLGGGSVSLMRWGSNSAIMAVDVSCIILNYFRDCFPF